MARQAPAAWPRRNAAAFTLRVLIVIVPIGASIGTGVVVSRLLPHPLGILGHIAWLVAVLGCSAIVFFATDRIARRFLPLGMLLRLSLIFPDQAPSRFAIALRASNTQRLKAWILEESSSDRPLNASRQAEAVLTLVTALGSHDRKTRGHSERVQALSDLMATELRLSDAATQRLRWAGLLHDIGKLAVPAEILNSSQKLDADSFAIIRTHPTEGARIAEPLASWLGEWRHGIDQHHERFDGTGYPTGLSGHEISLAGRIVAVTDAFETMTAVRSYKKAMSVADARAELVRSSGTHFDPEMVRSFVGLSIGRLRWTTGSVAVLAQLPLIGMFPRAGAALLAASAITVPIAVADLPSGQPSTASNQPVAGLETPAPKTAAVPATAAVSATAPAAELPAATSPPAGPAGGVSALTIPDPTPPIEQLLNRILAPLGVQLSLPPALATPLNIVP